MTVKEQELISDLLYTPYDYRDNLGLNENETFGLEIEYEAGVKRIIKYLLMRSHTGWNEVDEEYLTKAYSFGGEVVSPVLMDTHHTWKELVEVLKCIRMAGGKATMYTSGHIHFDKSFLNDNIEDYIYMLRMWCAFENIITKVSMGNFKSMRPRSEFMAASFTKSMLECNDRLNDIINLTDHMSFKEQLMAVRIMLNDIKRNSISLFGIENPDNIYAYNTFEVRIPNGSLNEVVWQNNVNFFAKFLRYFKTDYDKELIDHYFNSLYLGKEYNEFTMTLLLGSLIFNGDSEGNFNYLREYVRVMKKY